MSEIENPQDSDLSVANRVLEQFITAAAEDEQLAEVATRLRPLLLDEGAAINEALLRQALFEEFGE